MSDTRNLSRTVVPGAVIAMCFLAACAEEPAPAERPVDVGIPAVDELLLASAKVALPPPGITLDELPDADSSGARLLGTYCIACHQLPSPSIHSRVDWPSVLRRMWLRMGRLPEELAVPVPETAERMLMMNYVLDNALRVIDTDLPAGPGRERFTGTCARCHALPDPTQHSPEDWVAVVFRMMDNMDNMLGERLSEVERGRIITYLQEASG